MVKVTMYEDGSYTPESPNSTMSWLFDILRAAGMEPRGSTTYFTFKKNGRAFVIQIDA